MPQGILHPVGGVNKKLLIVRNFFENNAFNSIHTHTRQRAFAALKPVQTQSNQVHAQP
jgi:hypothetical protein